MNWKLFLPDIKFSQYLADILIMNWEWYQENSQPENSHQSNSPLVNSPTVCIGVSTPPSKTPPPIFCQVPPLNLQTIQAPLFRQSPLYIGFSWTPLNKLDFSVNTKIPRKFPLGIFPPMFWNIFKCSRTGFLILLFFHYCHRYHWYYLKDYFVILCFKSAKVRLVAVYQKKILVCWPKWLHT